MAKRIRHHTSKIHEEGVIPGCLWGVFHSFDIHQRLRLRKILGERRSTSNGRRAAGIKVSKMKTNVPQAADESDRTESDAHISSQVKERTDSADKASGKAQVRASVAQEISKQQDMPKQKGQRRKVTPFATRLLRTISIHHMECNDYTHSNERPNDSQNQEASLLSHNSDSSASNKHMPSLPETSDKVNTSKRCEVCGTISSPRGHVGHKKLDVLGYRLLEKQSLLREKLREAKKALLEQRKGEKDLQEDVALQRSNDLLEALELFNANNELFLRLLQEPGTTMSNYFQGQEDSRPGIVLTKSNSFPGAGLSAINGSSFKLRDETVPIIKQEGKSEAKNLQSPTNIDFTKDDKSQFTVDTLGPATCTHGIYETASSSESSSNFAHVVKHQSNSGAAAYHFKVIKQRIKDIIKENRKERQRISMDRVLHKIPYGYKTSHDIQDQKPCLWEGPDSDRCDGDSSSSTYRTSISSVQRSHSLTESLERYSYLLESSFSREPRRQISEKLKLAHDDCGFQVTRPSRSFGRIFSLPEFERYSSSKDDQSEVSNDFFHSRSTSVDLAQANEPIEINGTVEQNLSRTPDYEDPGTSVSDDETYASSDVLTTESMERADTSEKPSSLADIDPYLVEDPVSRAKFSVIQAGSKVKTDQIHFEEQDPSDDQHKQSNVDDSRIMETDGSNANDVQIAAMQLDFDSLHGPVGNKHEVEFDYVRDMLKTYLFDGNELSEGWSSPGKQLNLSVSEEFDGSAHKLEPNNGHSDINLERELLYDLTNQVLLEICESSYDHCPWLLRMGSHIRPVPAGYHLLEEVWANISWHLKSQPHANPTLEYIIDRDFKKNDGWMNVTFDIEYVGLDLEALLFDDLLDEAIVEFLDSDNRQCRVS